MKIQALKALVNAIELGSLRAAAKEMQVSQPAITKIIQELEEHLSTTLLNRTKTGVSPSTEGLTLYKYAQNIFQELEKAEKEVAQISRRSNEEITIAVVPLALSLLLPETIRTYSAEFPNVAISLMEELYIAQLKQLRSGEIDMAIGPIPKDLIPGEFHVEKILPIEMVIAKKKNLKIKSPANLEDLKELKWVYTSKRPTSGYAKVLFENNNITPPLPGAVVNSTLGLISLIASGNYVGLMPKKLMESPIAKKYLCQIKTVEPPLKLTLGVIVRHDKFLSPAIKNFIKHLHRAAAHI